MGVVSNASGQIDAVLTREVCQIGDGPHVAMRVHHRQPGGRRRQARPGDLRPRPAVLRRFRPSRIPYVGDSVTMDVGAAGGAGLAPILLDPYDHHADADFERIRSARRTELTPTLVAPP